MAQRINRLSDIKVKALKAEGMNADGNGLYLRVTASGSKGWIFRYKRAGRSRDMGLGSYPGISLAHARDMAGDARALVSRGLDPIEERKAKVAPPAPVHIVDFDEAARRYIAANEPSWRSVKHRQQWVTSLATYASPVIGSKDVAVISDDDVLRILEPIWHAKPETANRVRTRVENVLDWAKARNLRQGENPARWRGHLKHLLPSRKKLAAVRHHAALPWREMPEFMAELRADGSQSSLALRFIILTCVRREEAMEAVWPEINIAERVWTIPPERMKAGLMHRVPLSDAALDVLGKLIRVDGNPYLFPGARPMRPLRITAGWQLLRDMRPGLTVHGCRSSFRDWIAEATNFPRELAEVALAHIVGNETERAYQRGDLFEKRRKLMHAWADFCTQSTRMAKIIPLNAKA